MKKEFTPIAMKCSQEQFEAIKPKLKGMEIGCISNFNEWNYLVNNADGDPFVICNTGKSGSKRHSREIHETWNERIFLEACGIETEETFEITKETILKYRMKDEFPEVFEVKLEAGKWYKLIPEEENNSLICIVNINNKKCFGFKHNGIYFEESESEKQNFSFNKRPEEYILATEQEVFEALKNEAIKKYKVGDYLNNMPGFLSGTGNNMVFSGSTFFIDSDGSFCVKSTNGYWLRIMDKNGVWATILETKTKEEAEKLLNCKIV